MPTKIFNARNVPDLENLPITRQVIDLMNESTSTNTYDALRATMTAMVSGIAELEARVNALTAAPGRVQTYSVARGDTEP